jgi:hypothetical protein
VGGHTAAGGGELDETQRRVVGRDGLKGNVAVPLGGALLLGTETLVGRGTVVLLVLDRADGADLGVVAAEFPLRVEQGVDVQTGCRGAPGELAETQDQRLLQLVGEAVLGTEEDDAALGDGNGEVAEELVRVGCREPVGQLRVRELASDDGCDVK